MWKFCDGAKPSTYSVTLALMSCVVLLPSPQMVVWDALVSRLYASPLLPILRRPLA